MTAAPLLRPSLWLPEWLTDGKRPRLSDGRRPRKADGKRKRNAAGNTTCFCGCMDCRCIPQTILCTFSGIVLCTNCYQYGGTISSSWAATTTAATLNTTVCLDSTGNGCAQIGSGGLIPCCWGTEIYQGWQTFPNGTCTPPSSRGDNTFIRVYRTSGTWNVFAGMPTAPLGFGSGGVSYFYGTVSNSDCMAPFTVTNSLTGTCPTGTGALGDDPAWGGTVDCTPQMVSC